MGITAFPFSSVIDVPTARILGRDDAGTGAAEALTNTEIFAILGTGTPSASTYLRGDGTWATVSAGISSLNGLTDATQTFAVGTTGTNVAFSSAAGVHTLNIPDASATARGVVTTGTQTFAGTKTFGDTVIFVITYHYEIRGNQSRSGIHQSLGFITGAIHGGYKWTGGNTIDSAPDLGLERDAADRMGQRRTTNSQAFGVYNTYTSATSFERLNIAWATNVCYIGTEKGSAGGTARDLTLGTDGAVRLVLPAATTSGALYLGPRADNTTTGGNARGSGAVDLQTSRTAATQVASGQLAAQFGGAENTASSTRSVNIGGRANAATNSDAITVGGVAGIASGNRATTLGGVYPQATAENSATIGGYDPRATAEDSVVIGGFETTCAAVRGIAHGRQASGRLTSSRTFSGGQFAAKGDCQAFEVTLRGKTTTDVAVSLLIGGADRVTVPSGKILAVTVQILGSKSDGTAVADYLRQVCIKNVGGTTSLVGTVNTIGTDEAAGTSIAITADDTNDALQINVTGVLNETWRWVAVVYGVELAYGT